MSSLFYTKKGNELAETKKRRSIEERIVSREEMAQKHSNEPKVLKRKLIEQKQKIEIGVL